MSNSVRFWNAQGGKAEPLEIPSLFPLTDVERSKIRRLRKNLAYFQITPCDTEKQYSTNNYNRRINKYYLRYIRKIESDEIMLTFIYLEMIFNLQSFSTV